MPLDIAIYRTDRPWAEPKLDAFVKGLRRHGIEPEERRSDDWRVSDLAVVWAHRDTELHKAQLAAGQHYLVLERGYVGDMDNHRRFTSCGYNGLNGRADFCNAGAGPDRWERHFAGLMQSWKDEGDYALLMGQVRGDASLQYKIDVTSLASTSPEYKDAIKDIQKWYAETARALSTLGWTVMFRPHPRDPTIAPDGSYALLGSLEGALGSAGLCVTLNSTSGVDAVLSGVPTVAMDNGSMAWDVAAHNLDTAGFKPDRTVWANRLAHTMWNDHEMAEGTAWEHLRQKLD